MVINRFEVYLVNLDPTLGSEIKKTRPCLVVSPDEMKSQHSDRDHGAHDHQRTGLSEPGPVQVQGKARPNRSRSNTYGGSGAAGQKVGTYGK
jgi:hypothetical protein